MVVIPALELLNNHLKSLIKIRKALGNIRNLKIIYF